MLFKHVFIVGAGGIGSNLAEPLTRMLAYHERGTKNIHIIDGDSYEEKNRVRQLFSNELTGVNKAEATTKRLINFLGLEEKDCPIKSIPSYIDRFKFCDILVDTKVNLGEDLILVIMAVDNHATRKDLILALESPDSEKQNFVYISGGNGYTNGQVMVYAKIKGRVLTGAHPFDKYGDLKYPDDHIPGDGCQDEAPSAPQLITANIGAATGILWTIRAMLDDKNWFEELHFDSERMKLVPQGEPRKLILESEVIAELPVEDVPAKEVTLPAGLFSNDDEESASAIDDEAEEEDIEENIKIEDQTALAVPQSDDNIQKL